MHFKLNIRRYSPISHFHKIVNIMRLSLVLCMLTIFCASATVSYSQVNEISLHLEDATLEQALEAIKQQSEYSFWYRNDEINLGRKVSVNINNQNIANVLDRLLATQGLAYTINEKHIVIYKTNEKASHPMITNNKKITGKVTDEKNEPIIGANVVVKGSTTGTITDMDGNFTLEVPDQATLLVSYIGYTPKEVAVKNQNNLSIMMIEDSKTIDEVEAMEPIKIDQVVIGSCTNGRMEDLRKAAAILKGHTVHPDVRVMVIPATQKIYKECIKEGLLDIFVDAGCAVNTPSCGPCMGGHMGVMAAGEKCVSTTNRNFVGRMGHVDSLIYLASPEVAAASAIAGCIANPEKVGEK